MIVDLPETTTGAIARKLVSLSESGAAGSLARVLTLIVVTEDHDIERAVEAANKASSEHPCRVITVGRANRRGQARLDAQIRVGGDAGASEVIVLRLYGPLADAAEAVVLPLLLPDAPVVAWWPGDAPEDTSSDPIGRMATRRITDAAAVKNPAKALSARSAHYAPGDTDLSWSRLTRWRALLAAALDLPPYEPVTEIEVEGAPDSPSTDILAAWLTHALRAPVKRVKGKAGEGIRKVVLRRSLGDVVLERGEGSMAALSQPGQPTRQISLPRRPAAECISEELRRLDPDDVYGDVMTKGMKALTAKASPAKASPAKVMSSRTSAKKAAPKKKAAPAKSAPAKSAKEPGPALAPRLPAQKTPSRVTK